MPSQTTGKIAKVPGVFKLNEDVRRETLGRIYWKDKQYTKYANDYVKYTVLGTREVHPVTDGKDLLTYTHDRSTHYGYDIERRYTPDDVTRRTYTTDPVLWNRMWDGNYYDNFTFDTKLERVGVLELAKETAIAEYIHIDRHMEEKYITPQLQYFFGGSPGYNLHSLLKYGNQTPSRIPDIPEGDVSIIHDIFSNKYTPKTNKGYDYLSEQLVRVAKMDSFEGDGLDLFTRYFSPYVPVSIMNIKGRTYSNMSVETAVDLQGISHRKEAFSSTRRSSLRYAMGEDKKLSYDEGDALMTAESYLATGGVQSASTPDRQGMVSDYANFLAPSADSGKKKGLLDRTNDLFKRHKIATLVSRFHTSVNENGLTDEQEMTDTAKSGKFGNSHGRNLLKLGARDKNFKTNNYENPYCRVWTYHHEYDRLSRMIRPFVSFKEGENGEEVPVAETISQLYEGNPYATKYENGKTGGMYLEENTVLNPNGYVNIAPSNEGEEKERVKAKKCMFSIENLAWKDVPRVRDYLSDEQRGPNGGRIMWFPPYDLDFQESVHVDWNSSKFIGRGESVYTYSNTERSGTLSFSLLIDHPSVIDNIPKRGLSGQAPDNDPEGDILRFFAGCGLLGGPAESTSVDPVNPQKPSLNIPREVPSGEGSLIKFYVYYPNNYSGNMQSSSDSDWWEYLLFGKNTCLEKTDDPAPPPSGQYNKWSGYEVLAGDGNKNWSGITDHGVVQETGIKPTECRIAVNTGGTNFTTLSYGYRVDYDLRQKLFDEYTKGSGKAREPEDSNYNDSTSFQLNSSLKNKGEGATHTFMEAMYALEEVSGTITGFRKGVYSGYCDEQRVKLLKDVLNGEHGAYTVVVKGGATKQNSPNSDKLATRRATTVRRQIEKMIGRSDVFPDNDEIGGIIVPQDLKNDPDDNTLNAKKERFAVVEIRYGLPEVKDYSASVSGGNTGSVKNEEAEKKVKKAQEEEEKNKLVVGVVAESEDTTVKRRYEDEGEYFKKLKLSNKFLYEKLVEKFKYFTPAFHSISPEGFNARLTFLQQCTRQGHTIESSSLQGYAMTAGNLSFGRMPVCVLRIGDFLNTKVLINSVSINYSPGGATQWDLNPEGIGVQPMYAKVSLGLVILGGQSLSGPVNRLQNAVSFNYYANTGVYDDRSDIAMPTEVNRKVTIGGDSFEVSGSGTEYSHIWTPNPRNKK